MSSNPVRERVAAVPGIVTGATLLALAALVVSCGRTDDDGDETGSRVVDGMIAYFGVVPSQVVGTHDPDHPEAAMHGGVPGGAALAPCHRIAVRTGRVATDNGCGAHSHRHGVESRRTRGDQASAAFTVNRVLSYGNYFDFELHRRHRIDVTVRRAGRPGPAEFTFHR
jgi:hypothetical protein